MENGLSSFQENSPASEKLFSCSLSADLDKELLSGSYLEQLNKKKKNEIEVQKYILFSYLRDLQILFLFTEKCVS